MKRLLAFLCAVLMLSTLFLSCKKEEDPPQEEPPAGEEDPALFNYVSHDCPAVRGENGQRTDLWVSRFEVAPGQYISGMELTWSSNDIKVEEGRYVTPARSGVYALTAAHAGGRKTFYLVSKDGGESEYILYRQDFANGIPADFRVADSTGSQVRVENGMLLLDAMQSSSSNARVLLPAFLADFGDYKITADMEMREAEDNKRWTSIVFRAQGTDSRYLQFAVRQRASADSGVELAQRVGNSWSVWHKSKAESDLSSDRLYRMTVDVCGHYATAAIDGVTVVSGERMEAHPRGDVGLQANRCVVAYDNIKVTLPEVKDITRPTGAKTGILNAAAILFEAGSVADLNAAPASNATHTVMRINGDLKVVNGEGTPLIDYTDAIRLLEGWQIPVFRPDSTPAATALAQALKEKGIFDCMILSDDPALLRNVRETHPALGNVLDLRSLQPNGSDKQGQLEEIREKSNQAGSRICLLGAAFADKTAVEYLTRRATAVWLDCPSANITDHIRALTSGAHGILTADVSLTAAAMGDKYFAPNSILRPVQVIGHRGMPSAWAENTIMSSNLALNAGATVIENDIYITTDGKLVVMHDGTIDRTTDGTGRVEDMTLAQLRQYRVNVNGANDPIPTLEDYFETYKGQNVVLFIEIKSTKASVVPALKTLIERYDIMDQCAVITFHEAQAERVRTQIPGLSCGYLTGNIGSAAEAMTGAGAWDATFNPDYKKLSPEMVRALTLRGITTWPYTLNDADIFDSHFLAGASGLTTNYATFATDYLWSLDTDAASYTLTAGGYTEVALTKTTYGGETAAATAEMIRISGNETVGFSGGRLTATAQGEATVMFRTGYTLQNGETVYIYTQPVTVTVG